MRWLTIFDQLCANNPCDTLQNVIERESSTMTIINATRANNSNDATNIVKDPTTDAKNASRSNEVDTKRQRQKIVSTLKRRNAIRLGAAKLGATWRTKVQRRRTVSVNEDLNGDYERVEANANVALLNESAIDNGDVSRDYTTGDGDQEYNNRNKGCVGDDDAIDVTTFETTRSKFYQGPGGWWFNEMCAVSFDDNGAMVEADIQAVQFLISLAFPTSGDRAVVTLDWFVSSLHARNNSTRACVIRYDANNNVACVLISNATVRDRDVTVTSVQPTLLIALTELLFRRIRFVVLDRYFNETMRIDENFVTKDRCVDAFDNRGWLKLSYYLGRSNIGVIINKLRSGMIFLSWFDAPNDSLTSNVHARFELPNGVMIPLASIVRSVTTSLSSDAAVDSYGKLSDFRLFYNRVKHSTMSYATRDRELRERTEIRAINGVKDLRRIDGNYTERKLAIDARGNLVRMKFLQLSS